MAPRLPVKPPRLAGIPASAAALAVLTAALFAGFADLSLIGPFLDPLLADFFADARAVSPLGWVSFAVTALSAAAMIAAGVRADRGRRVGLARAGCLVAGAAALFTALAPHGRPGYAVFFAGRVLGGAGTGAIVPVVFSLTADLVPSRRRGSAFAVLSVAMLSGRMGGFLLAGALAGRWRSAYVVAGLAELAAAAALLRVREPRRGIQEQELQAAVLAGAEYRFRISLRDIRLLRRARSNVWLVLNFIDVIPGAIVLFLIFKYMKDAHGVGPGPANLLVLVAFLLGAAGALVFGRLGDWGFRRDKRARAWTAALCNAAPIVFMGLFVLSRARLPDGATAAAALRTGAFWELALIIGGAMFVSQGVNPNWYGTITDVNLPEHRATMIALASVMDLAGSALGPLAASLVADSRGLRAAMASTLLFWAANVLLWLPVVSSVRGDLGRTHALLAKRAAEIGGAPGAPAPGA